MDNAQTKCIKSYILRSARPLDVALFKYKFEDGPADDIVKELKKYQNSDKGFGHSLEPDIQSTSSSVICTTVALQYLQRINADSGNQLAIDALTYLDENYDSSYLGWHPIGPDIENAPHAPWWDYKRSLTAYEWGNPSAEIIGYYIKYGYSSAKFSIDTMLEKVITELRAATDPEVHAVKCYLRMFKMAEDSIKQIMKDVLFSHIKKVVELDSSQWGEYIPQPLDFLENPTDEVASLFSNEIIKKNIDYIKTSLFDNHWEPSWNWGDQHPEAWKRAKKSWSGKLTAENSILLDKFKSYS